MVPELVDEKRPYADHQQQPQLLQHRVSSISSGTSSGIRSGIIAVALAVALGAPL